MKTQIYVLLMASVFLFSCKEQNKESKKASGDATMIEEAYVEEVPNQSDLKFEEALLAFENLNFKKAAQNIRQGIHEMEDESFDDDKSFNEKAFESSIKKLRLLSGDVENGKIKDVDVLRETFANATLSMSHDYLMFDDIFILQNPENVNATKLNKAFYEAKESFETLIDTEEFTDKAIKDANEIMSATADLQADRKALDKKIKLQLDKMQKFVETHKPDAMDPYLFLEYY